jgi:hypothetical protein
MSNSITGAIADRFQNSSDAATLRTLVTALYADITNGTMVRPFIVVSEDATSLFGEARNTPYAPQVRIATINFDVYASNRPQAETILDATETVFLELAVQLGTYTFDNYTYLGTQFANRLHNMDTQGWYGLLQLAFQYHKN